MLKEYRDELLRSGDSDLFRLAATHTSPGDLARIGMINIPDAATMAERLKGESVETIVRFVNVCTHPEALMGVRSRKPEVIESLLSKDQLPPKLLDRLAEHCNTRGDWYLMREIACHPSSPDELTRRIACQLTRDFGSGERHSIATQAAACETIERLNEMLVTLDGQGVYIALHAVARKGRRQVIEPLIRQMANDTIPASDSDAAACMAALEPIPLELAAGIDDAKLASWASAVSGKKWQLPLQQLLDLGKPASAAKLRQLILATKLNDSELADVALRYAQLLADDNLSGTYLWSFAAIRAGENIDKMFELSLFDPAAARGVLSKMTRRGPHVRRAMNLLPDHMPEGDSAELLRVCAERIGLDATLEWLKEHPQNPDIAAVAILAARGVGPADTPLFHRESIDAIGGDELRANLLDNIRAISREDLAELVDLPGLLVRWPNLVAPHLVSLLRPLTPGGQQVFMQLCETFAGSVNDLSALCERAG